MTPTLVSVKSLKTTCDSHLVKLLLRVPILVLFFLAAAGLAYCVLTLERMLRYPNQGGRFYAYS